MNSPDDWGKEADQQGRAWYSRHHALRKALKRPPLSRAECQHAARFAADTWFTMTLSPAKVTQTDKAQYVEAFVQGAVAAWQDQQ